MYRVRWEKQKNDDKFWPFQTKRAEFELMIEIAQFFFVSFAIVLVRAQ